MNSLEAGAVIVVINDTHQRYVNFELLDNFPQIQISHFLFLGISEYVQTIPKHFSTSSAEAVLNRILLHISPVKSIDEWDLNQLCYGGTN